MDRFVFCESLKTRPGEIFTQLPQQSVGTTVIENIQNSVMLRNLQDVSVQVLDFPLK